MSFNPSKVILASACALSLATVALPASAQTGTTQSPGTTTTSPSTTTTDAPRDDRGFDWGWLGLLGLAGLAGLKRKPEQTQVYRDPNEVGRTGSRM
ncbi:MAG TPA: WGxxGxxG family protein [Thermosynechococcaceae cyanobacterium]